MQIGVPLCVTAVGGMEYLLKMSTGCRTSGEAGDIAQNIRYIVENANYREQIVHNAKQLFIREYSSASMAQSYEQAYCNLLTQKACPKIK
jgi:glycosyltransferase involved in cell wall biosynthesis